MGLIITPVNEYTDAGEFRGILQDIACGCWFTQNGKTIPKLIRAMDERGGVFCQVLFPEKSVGIPFFQQGIFPAFSGHYASLRMMACSIR